MFTNIKILLISVTLLTGLMLPKCGKSINPQQGINLIGQWQWVNSVGGIAGVTRTPETEGYYKSLTFDSDSTYIIYETNRLVNDSSYQGTYYINYEAIPFWSHIDSAYVIHMEHSEPAIIEIDGNSLSMEEMCADCFNHTYVKMTE